MSNRFIRKEDLVGMKRWNLAELGKEGMSVNGAQAPERRGAYAEGFEEGRRAGAEAGRAAVLEQVQRLAAAADAAEAALHELGAKVASEVVDLALVIAQHVVREEIQARPEAVLPLVREAIGALPHATQHAELVVHPDDAATVRAHLGEQLSRMQWRIVEEPGMSRGGCRINATGGDVDATVEQRWKAIADALGKEHESSV